MNRAPKVVRKKLGRQKLYGQAIPSTGTIEIDPRQTEREFLGTLVHESAHIACPYLNEDEIVKIEAVISGVLWREGYRRRQP